MSELTIVSCNSELLQHLAKNMLDADLEKTWQSLPKTKKAIIILSIKPGTEIKSIEIGNYGTPFIEIFVGKEGQTAEEFKVLLPASVFMQLKDVKSGSNRITKRGFGLEKFDKNIASKKWDFLRIVCTNPWIDVTPEEYSSLGLSFIHVNQKIQSYDTKQKTELYTNITSHADNDENESASEATSSSEETNKNIKKNQEDEEEKMETDSPLNKQMLDEMNENIETNKSHMMANWLYNQGVKAAPKKNKIEQKDMDDDSGGTEEMQEDEIQKLTKVIKVAPPVQSLKGKEKVKDDASDSTEEIPDAEIKEATAKLQERNFDSDSTEEIPSTVLQQAEKELKGIFNQNIANGKTKPAVIVDDDSKSDGTEEMNVEELFILKTQIKEFDPKLEAATETLPNFLSGVRVFIFPMSDFNVKVKHMVFRYTVAYGGKIEEILTDNTTHIVTLRDSHPQFSKLEDENIDIVKPSWIQKCHEMQKRVDIGLHSVKKRK